MECMCVGVDACVSACEGEAERERETEKWGDHACVSARTNVWACVTQDNMIFQVRGN